MMLIPKVTKIAISVEAPSINAMTSGPASLHTKSIRRIRAFRPFLVVSIRKLSGARYEYLVFRSGVERYSLLTLKTELVIHRNNDDLIQSYRQPGFNDRP